MGARASCSCDLYDDKSTEAIIIAQGLFAKFPPEVKGEILRISGTTYPTLSTLLKETPRIVKQLLVARQPTKVRMYKPRLQPKIKPGEMIETSSLKTFNTELRFEEGCDF